MPISNLTYILLRDPSFGRECKRAPLFLYSSRLHCNHSPHLLPDTSRTAQTAKCFQNGFTCIKVVQSSREERWSLIVSYKRRTAFMCGETAHTMRREVNSVLAATRCKKKMVVWPTVRTKQADIKILSGY
jgi:hypothetical protein